MSTEYTARMEVLQRRREELTAQRQAVEKRVALREATAAEFSAVALQSYKHKWKAQRSAAIAAKKRNDEFVHSLHETQRQVHDTWGRLQGDQSSSSALLAQEKARYNRRVEQIFPAWQQQLQRQRVQKLRELEDKKREVERRRYLAKKSFEKEQTLGDLIRKTRHEVEMAENLEQNELYERELLRTQSTNQAKEVDQSIREVALEARSYLQQQAEKHLEVMPKLDEELAEKLSETFSPRNTLRALREGNSSLAFEENQEYEDEEISARQIRVEIPARMNTSTRPYYPDMNQRYPNQGYRSEETFEDDYVEEIPRRFDEGPAFLDPSVTERHQTTTIGSARNDYMTFEQSATIAQAPLVLRDQLVGSGNMTSTSGAIFSQQVSRPDMSQQRIGSNRHEEMTKKSYGNVEVLPTFVTGKLDPIPEANEQVSLHGTSSMMLNAVNFHSAGTENERKSDITGISNSISLNPASESIKSSQGLRSSTPPAKIEENRVANTPATPIGITTPVAGTPSTPVDADRADVEYHAVLEPVIEDVMIEEPPTTSAPAVKETFVVSPSMYEGKTEFLAGTSVQQSQNEVRGKAHNKASTLDERDAVLLDVEKMSIPRKPDEAFNSVNTLSDFGSEGSLEMKGSSIEPIDDIMRSGIIEVVPIASMKDEDDRELDPSPSCKNTSTMESLHDATYGSTDESPSITASHTSGAAEASVHEHEESISDIVPVEVPEPAIPYSFDLLEPLSPPALKPTNALAAEEDMLLTSMQSDDFDLSATNVQPVAKIPSIISASDTIVKSKSPVAVDPATNSASKALKEANTASITEKLSPVDRVKALAALISRTEEGATEGDTLGGSVDTGSSNDSKRELLKMAVGGRKAQIAFFGSDICFELIIDISRDLGPVLFPPKAFEGIMNDQKLRKLHQSNKEKQLDLWKALSGHMKQLVQLKTISSSTLVDMFVTAFLAHDPDNQRSQRKLREFLVTVCGGKTPSPRKERSTTSPPPSPPKQEQRTPSPDPAKTAEPEGRIGTPALLQTAFLQRQSPPKHKVFGIASSSFKDRSSGSSDVLASMSSGPMTLSQKLMRGGKMNDYSEFEEEEEVDLQNLIGTKSALGRSTYQATKRSPTGKTAAKQAALEEEDDEFDADF
ncbi:hypothetical protein KRP22_011208 [Phytophthora ramorum]|uniref:uncharacterized protein n=1 Tax=Phytophthora ramorum TaxID=164328 RepID=UPI003097FBFE|nr:hypothetical protein KRP23_5003 [Phytophthora ramorum]KAH7504425.1 hypothetical protein KRP22_4917 [Phytophthora ramorum]